MATDPARLKRALDVLAKRDAPLQSALQRLGGEQITAWVHGALRHRRTIGVVLGAVARRALKNRSTQQVATLELLGYRRLFLNDSLEAVLADAANLADGKKGAAHVARVLTALDAAIVAREPLEAAVLGDDCLTLSRTEAVRFKTPLLGAETRSAAGRLGIHYSLPDPLVAAWIEAHGVEQAPELCRSTNDPPPLFARANGLVTTRDALIEALAAEGIGAEAVGDDAPHAIRLTQSRGRFRSCAPWKAGAFSIQDLTAQRAAPLLQPQPGERLLDLCAAPGGKTTHLAELSGDQAEILACDVVAARLKRVDQNVERLQLRSIQVRAVDGRKAGEELVDLPPFDGILVDAPCSNTGVLRRRPEARWRYTVRSQQRIAGRQAELLQAALTRLAPGGRLVYSVCSIEPEEGAGQVAALLEARSDLTLEHEELWLPSALGGDGGYAARIRRT